MTIMVLADIGNSRLKLGWLDTMTGAREPQPTACAHTATDTITSWLHTLPGRPTRAIGVNVAGPNAADLLQHALGLPVRWIRGDARAAGVRNGYQTPGQLGADRWAALVGLAAHAAEHAAQPLILASYGTATTIDTLGPACAEDPATPTHRTRRFIGGLILPGPALMLSSLAHGTANLPLAQGPVVDFPVNTDQAIASGMAAAQAGALMRQWELAAGRFGRAPLVYVSGGGWPLARLAVEQGLRTLANRGTAPAPAVTVLAAPVLDGLAQLALLPDATPL